MADWDAAETVAGLLADASRALADSESDTSSPGLVVTIGLRDVVRRLEQLQRSHAYEIGLADGTVKRLWP